MRLLQVPFLCAPTLPSLKYNLYLARRTGSKKYDSENVALEFLLNSLSIDFNLILLSYDKKENKKKYII